MTEYLLARAISTTQPWKRGSISARRNWNSTGGCATSDTGHNCNELLLTEVNYLNRSQGCALCHNCGYPDIGARTLSINALKVLHFWLHSGFTTASRVKLSVDLPAR